MHVRPNRVGFHAASLSLSRPSSTQIQPIVARCSVKRAFKGALNRIRRAHDVSRLRLFVTQPRDRRQELCDPDQRRVRREGGNMPGRDLGPAPGAPGDAPGLLTANIVRYGVLPKTRRKEL
eukprot:360023-Chlamydomonas_euryale.AAC.6